jgi:hypothetical protein
MVAIDPWDVPYLALEAIQRAAGLSIPPRVISAAKHQNRRSFRWRIETDKDTWRVTQGGGSWKAILSE